jgi:chaperone required for assembly of F1-ATPase
MFRRSPRTLRDLVMPADSASRPAKFYKTAASEPFEAGFAILLDGRAVRTPRRQRLVAPTAKLGALIAGEWDAQAESVDLAAMPATRLAFTAVDRIAEHRAETVAEIVNFAASDLLCYRAEAPSSLVERQAKRWGIMLDWAREDLGLTFVLAEGIIHKPQPQATLQKVGELAAAGDDFALAGLAFAANLFGSAVLALALWRDQLDGDAAFDLSRLDETFQEERWGVDDEAAARTARRRAEAEMLDRWFQALR